MGLTPGTRLGIYEVAAQIGLGGMGEVYRATDTNLKRAVALKVLPASVAADIERLARFQREAEVLAALNHPNIAAIYGLERSGPTTALVMELVEGEDLSERIARGAMPVDEALAIARQIAEALEAAHEQGIIHRDLKPANIKVRPDGTVKVLDFGLAKAMDVAAVSSSSLSMSPTITTPAMTASGVILGTAAYMSPEQAKGRAVDRRADVWAFGAVLYEMLTGRRPFAGDDVTDTLANVLKMDPRWDALGSDVPPRVLQTLRMCLQKDPRRRAQAIGDVRLALDGAFEVASPAPIGTTAKATRRPSWLPWAAAAIAAIAAAIAAPLSIAHVREEPAAAEPVRFEIFMPDKVTLGGGAFSVSPDGRKVVFAATAADGTRRLYVRALDSIDARPLQLTEGAGPYPPFWSPDSRFVGFSIGNKYMKIDVTGGPPQTLCEMGGTLGGGSWGPNGVILLSANPGGLVQVPETGGIPSPVTVPITGQEIYHGRPAFLPDGRHFLYLRVATAAEHRGTAIGSLDVKPEAQDQRLLLAAPLGVNYAPSADRTTGYVLFERDGTVMAQTFDTRKLQLTGQPVPIAEQVGNNGAISAFFWPSENGVLTFRTGGTTGTELGWMDRGGNVTARFGNALLTTELALSPDGTRAAFHRPAEQRDLWVYDFARGTTTRLTFSPSIDRSPVWSPDGKRIVFASDRGGRLDLYQKSANGDGEDELLFKSDQDKVPTSWSRDGRFLLFQSIDPKMGADIWVLPMEGERKPVPFLRTEFTEGQAAFSPDGRWIAYVSTESGRPEVYVRAFVPPGSAPAESTGGKWQISKAGGTLPRWRGDSKELFYAVPGSLMAVDISAVPSFQAGSPHPLFNLVINNPGSSANLQVTPDGKRFITDAPPLQTTGQRPITVVLNWPALMKK